MTAAILTRRGATRSWGPPRASSRLILAGITFTHFPDGYEAWWGVPSLPEVREEEPSFLEYITGENGIARRWLRLGADGWRLDVADELPDGFLERFRAAVKAEKPDALLLGEVWEDATTKVSYGHRRRYLLGGQLDSVMNYPWREAVLQFLRGGDGEGLWKAIDGIVSRYPPPAVHALMNHLGTHDTARLITELGGDPGDGQAARVAGRGGDGRPGARPRPPPGADGGRAPVYSARHALPVLWGRNRDAGLRRSL